MLMLLLSFISLKEYKNSGGWRDFPVPSSCFGFHLGLFTSVPLLPPHVNSPSQLISLTEKHQKDSSSLSGVIGRGGY